MSQARIALNRISLSKALLSDMNGYMVTVDHAKELLRHSVVARIQGCAINQQYEGNELIFDLEVSTNLNGQYLGDSSNFSCKLLNLDEITSQIPQIQGDLTHILNGLHEVVKTNIQAFHIESKKFQENRKFIEMNLDSEDQTKTHSHYKASQRFRLSSQQPLHIIADKLEYYMDGFVWYWCWLQVPTQLESYNYSINGITIEPTLIQGNREIATNSMLLGVNKGGFNQYKALTLFRNVESLQTCVLTADFDTPNEALTKLNEIWYCRTAIYQTLINTSGDFLTPIHKLSRSLDEEKKLMLEGLIMQLVLEPTQFTHHQQKRILVWSGTNCLKDYELVLGYQLNPNKSIDFISMELFERKQKVCEINSMTFKELLSRSLVEVEYQLNWMVSTDKSSLSYS